MNAKRVVSSATLWDTYSCFLTGETTIKGTRNPNWSKLAQLSGYRPVGSALSSGQSDSASPTLVSTVPDKLNAHSAPCPGSKLSGGFDKSAHCPGEIPSGARAPPCGAFGGVT